MAAVAGPSFCGRPHGSVKAVLLRKNLGSPKPVMRPLAFCSPARSAANPNNRDSYADRAVVDSAAAYRFPTISNVRDASRTPAILVVGFLLNRRQRSQLGGRQKKTCRTFCGYAGPLRAATTEESALLGISRGLMLENILAKAIGISLPAPLVDIQVVMSAE